MILGPSFLLDASVLSDLIRRPQGRVAGRLVREGEGSVCMNIIIGRGLRLGVAKHRSQRLEEPADRRYGDLRDHLEQQGTPIGPNGMLIAAHLPAPGLAVVADNVWEFSRVPGAARRELAGALAVARERAHRQGLLTEALHPQLAVFPRRRSEPE
jgi:tRNA(fMet)-specific endonuclease VapC